MKFKPLQNYSFGKLVFIKTELDSCTMLQELFYVVSSGISKHRVFGIV